MGNFPSVIGPYRVIRPLGKGGMGAVYQAVHERIDRRVAIKVLHPEYAHSTDMAQRFINEARAVNRVEHPGLVQISDYGQLPDGSAYIVMEFLQGETLGRRLERAGRRLPLFDTLQITWQLADSLTSAHDKGVIHRDLKPANVMLVPDPHMQLGERTKLLDFGLAKMSEPPGLGVQTRSNVVMGTPLYMSPEQCEGAGRVDARSDVYSLGVMLYEMLSGQPPFVGDGPGLVMGMHMFKPPQPLRERNQGVPEPVADLCHLLLTKDREQRPSMKQVARALEDMLNLAPSAVRRRSEAAGLPEPGDEDMGMDSTLDFLVSQSRVASLGKEDAGILDRPSGPAHFRVCPANHFSTPAGYLYINLDRLGKDRLFIRPSEYDSLRSLLNDIYLEYLKEQYNPYSYGHEWVLMEEETGRLLVDWSWLSCVDKQTYLFDRDKASTIPLSSCGLNPTSKWQIMPVVNTRLCFGIAVNSEELFSISLRYKKKLRLLQECGLLETTHATKIDHSQYSNVGIFALSPEDVGIAEDEVFAQRDLTLSSEKIREIVRQLLRI